MCTYVVSSVPTLIGEIAEIDLKMRGGGLISGFEQSGSLDFKLANMSDNLDIFKAARKDAALILRDETLQTKYIKDYLSTLNKKIEEINFS